MRLVEAASPAFRFGPGLVMAFIHASTCSSVIRLIGTSAKVTEASVIAAVSDVPSTQAWTSDHRVNHWRKVVFPAAGST